MMKRLLLLLLLCFTGCSEKETLTGNWKLEIKLQDKVLPVIVNLHEDKSGTITGELYNSSEVISLRGSSQGNKFKIEIGVSYAEFQGELKNSELKGEWVRNNKENYRVPFTGKVYSKKDLFKSYEADSSLLNISGDWKVKLKVDEYGMGSFTQKGARVQGSILTTTGDYRYLDGFIDNNQVKLYGFDGVFSFVLELVMNKDKFIGTMTAGRSSHKDISAVRDDTFSLSDPHELTKATSDKKLKLKFTSIDNEEIDFDGIGYKGKAKIVQIFGSWCPNCIDETNYFVKWRADNAAKLNDIKFVSLAFERSESRKKAILDLRKVKGKLGMDYPVVLVDFDKSVKMTDILPLDKTVAFPTTLFLDKNNKIYKIHTGFSGQATGKFFDKFKVDFENIVEHLITN